MNTGKTSHNYYLGTDIGGTKCTIVLGDKNFRIHEKIVFPTRTDQRGYQEVLDECKTHMHGFVQKYGSGKLSGIGISCGGPLDAKKGMILSPPNLPGWDNVPIVEMFRDEFGVDVALQNDANAGALAEWMLGAGQGTQNMIFLTMGTGMGAGLILNGQLYTGTNDLGGEVGHIRLAEDGPEGFGKAGSFEGFCSGGGIARLARKMVADKLENGVQVAFCPSMEMIGSLTARILFEAAGKKDPDAMEIVRIAAEYLGKGLAILIDILNPERIVIGTIFSQNESLIRPYVEKVIAREAIPAAREVCEIVPATLGEKIGDYAALCVALKQ